MEEMAACLRMDALVGNYPLPTSERAYRQNISLIDVAMPMNGGLLQADGTWLQRPGRTETEFAQALPAIVREAGQRYMPVLTHTGETADILCALFDAGLQEVAADNLITLLESRFDAPWDAAIYDIQDVPVERLVEHEDFVSLLSYKVRATGIPFGIAYHGLGKWEPSPFSLKVIAQAADVFHYYLYAWWVQPRMVGPYWWARVSLDNALAAGVPAQRIVLGSSLFSSWWPDAGSGVRRDMTHGQALEIAHEHNARIEWMETSEFGLVRERFADTGDGYIALTDGDTLQHRLDLVDGYALAGVMLFCPGMGDESVWRAIARWKQPSRRTPVDTHQGAGYPAAWVQRAGI